MYLVISCTKAKLINPRKKKQNKQRFTKNGSSIHVCIYLPVPIVHVLSGASELIP